MKKIILSAFAILAIATSINAQGFRIGAKAGANLNKVTGKSFNEEYDLGYHLGAFMEIDFSKRLGIQPEILFNQINTTRSSDFSSIYSGANFNSGSDIQLKYLSIPILLRYNVGSLITLNAGPQFGVLIDDKENLLTNGQSAFKKGDFSMVAGAGINLKRFRVYGRYNIGLANINDIDNRDEWKNQQIQLGVGVRL